MASNVDEVLVLIGDLTQHQELSATTKLAYLNSFYRNQFQMDIGMAPITKMWNFQTLADVDEYAVSETYRLINTNDLEINGSLIDLYFDRILFDSYFQDAYQIDESIGTGDASEVTFTGTLTKFPVVKKSMIVSDDTETFKDEAGDGNLVGSLGGSGSITYSTGVYSVTFNSAPADGQAIVTTYAEYTAAQPDGALFYNNVIKFRPVPDGTYDINIQVAERPAALVIGGTLPNELWGDALAYGTGIDIHDRYGNEEDAVYAERVYRKKLQPVLKHGYKIKASTQRAYPKW